MSMKKLLYCIALGLGSSAFAGPILTRPELQTILGGPGTLENFEGYAPSPGGADFFPSP